MEEQTTDIEVTVKTLDSQSRTYTVRSQVNAPICIVELMFFCFVFKLRIPFCRGLKSYFPF